METITHNHELYLKKNNSDLKDKTLFRTRPTGKKGVRLLLGHQDVKMPTDTLGKKYVVILKEEK